MTDATFGDIDAALVGLITASLDNSAGGVDPDVERATAGPYAALDSVTGADVAAVAIPLISALLGTIAKQLDHEPLDVWRAVCSVRRQAGNLADDG